MSDVIDTLNDQEMVDQANALLDRNRELQAEIDRLLRVNSEKHRSMMEWHQRAVEAESRLGKIEELEGLLARIKSRLNNDELWQSLTAEGQEPDDTELLTVPEFLRKFPD